MKRFIAKTEEQFKAMIKENTDAIGLDPIYADLLTEAVYPSYMDVVSSIKEIEESLINEMHQVMLF